MKYRALVLSALAAGCGPGGSGPPEVSPAGTLAPGLEERHSTELSVISASPQGQAETKSPITIVFNKPLRALSLADDVEPPPIAVSPPVPGTFQWHGTSAVTLASAAEHLRPATRYEVTVPAGLRAADGTQLAGAFVFSFETPRPKLVSIKGASSRPQLAPGDAFEVEYDQPVSAAALQAALSIEATSAAGTRRIPATVMADPDGSPRLRVVPGEPLPLAAQIQLRIAAELVGEAGALPAGRVEERAFATYGPLTATLECPRSNDCPSSLALRFTNPVKLGELRRALQITPPVRIGFGGPSADRETRTVQLFGDFVPQRRYVLKLDESLKDVFGQALAGRFEVPFTTAPPPPSVTVGAFDGFLEPALGSFVPFAATRLPAIELTTVKLSPQQLGEWFALGADDPEAQLGFLREQPNARSQRLPLAASQGLLQRQRVALTTALEGDRHGSFALIVHDPASDGEVVNVLHPTNLAVTSKLSRAGGLVWVTRLSDGRPVARASVELDGRTWTTDAGGVARLAADALTELASADAGQLLVVRSGDDWVYEQLGETRREPPYEPYFDGDYQHRTLGSVFVDRGIYRPGEPVHVKGWLRAEREIGTAPLAGRRLQLVLAHRGHELARQQVQTNEFGGFSARFDVPAQTSLGEYAVVASGQAVQFRTSFRVGEYRSAAFLAELNAVRASLVRGEEARFTVGGEYLFGARMAAAQVKFRAVFRPTSFHPRGAEGFSTDAWAQLDASPKSGVPAPADAKLDAQGRHEARMLAAYEGPGPANLDVYAGVSDVTLQEGEASAHALVHPGSFYVGIKAPAATPAAGLAFEPEVIAVQPDGVRRAGVPVIIELHRRSGFGGAGQASETAVAVASCATTTTTSAATCALTAREPGHYYLLARATDERDNPLLAGQWLWVAGKARGAARRRTETDSGSLELVLDRESYRPGDTARVLVRAPWKDAEVLVSLERAGVHWFEQRRLADGSGTFEIPIDERTGPNATVAVHAARGRSKPLVRGPSPDGFGPTIESTAETLRIDTGRQRLAVDVLPELGSVKPGAKVKVRLRVRDESGRGRRAELAVYAVDEGVLMLTGYTTPDVLDDFTPERPSTVGYADTRERLGWLYEPDAGYGYGVGSGRLGGSHASVGPRLRLAGARVRQGFTTTPYFEPHVVTDERGEAEVTVPLAEALTRYRVMAVAVTADDHYGSGEAGVTTSLELMARPALPRFARVGDRFHAAVVLTSKGFEPGPVRVRVQAQGLSVHGPSEKSALLGPDGNVEVAFAVSAPGPGKARVRFEIEARGRRDAVEQELAVSLPIAPQAVATYGKTRDAAGERLGDLRAMRRDYGGLRISVSSSALVGLEQGFDQLIEYPYGCTEQLSSRVLPLLPLRDLAKDFGIALPAKVDDELAATIAKLIERQLGDGSFGLWPGASQGSPWLTAYVFRTLDEGGKRGAVVPDHVLQGAYDYLVRFSNGEQSDRLSAVSRVYVAYVLAEYGKPEYASLSALYENERDLPLFAKALLLHAFALSRDGDVGFLTQRHRAIEALSKTLTANVHLDGSRALVQAQSREFELLFDSPARTTALVLRALLAANPKHPLADELARGLLSQRRHGTWRSTQETSFALLALDAYRRAQEAEVPAFDATVWLGQRALGASSHRGRELSVKTFEVSAARLGDSTGDVLAFQKAGQGTLFYEALLRYAPKQLPKTDLDRGFAVQFGLHRLSASLPPAVAQGTAPSETAFWAGQAVVGEIAVTTASPRSFVVIDAPLPAGFEAVDLDLRTSSRLFDGGGAGSPWSHRELRDDRVVYFVDSLPPGVHRYRFLARATSRGSFVLPPVLATEMYAPEVFGRTAAQRIQVR